MASKISTFYDNFAIASATKWNGFGSNPSVVAGQLNIVPSSSYADIYSKTAYDCTDSMLFVNLVQAPNVGNGTSSTVMSVSPSNSNSAQILVEGSNLTFREQVSNINSDTSITYSALTHAWLRLRFSGASIYWDTSADGLNWTQQRTKLTTLNLTSCTVNFFAGFYGNEPSPGVAIWDNLNLAQAPITVTGWTVGATVSAIGGVDGGTVVAGNTMDLAAWLWDPIPTSPVLDVNSAAIVTELASGNGHGADMYDYGATIIGPSNITTSTPRYTINFANVPSWGPSPFGTDTVPIPNGTEAMIPPGTDGHLSILDPISGKIYSIWQATYAGGVWGGSWGGIADLHGDGRETKGSSTATALARPAGVVRVSEISALQIPHALFFASDICATSGFRYPAQKTDGDNASGVSIPIQEGTRVQLDPALNVDAISGITPVEAAVAKALQTYGAYCGDKGGGRMAFIFEFAHDGSNPGVVYSTAGLSYDYFDFTHIPFSSLRVLNSWNGS